MASAKGAARAGNGSGTPSPNFSCRRWLSGPARDFTGQPAIGDYDGWVRWYQNCPEPVRCEMCDRCWHDIAHSPKEPDFSCRTCNRLEAERRADRAKIFAQREFGKALLQGAGPGQLGWDEMVSAAEGAAS